MTEIQKKLNDYAVCEMNYWDFFGVIRVIHKGEILFEASRGYSSLEHNIKNNIETRFTVASVTKQFTAFAIMILYDRGLLNLHETANCYLPSNMQLPSEISIHNLLTHTSGLYNYYNFEDDFYVGDDKMPYDKNDFFTRWICKKPIAPVGTEYNYNNSNYNLLAWVIEYVSGQSYAEFIKNNIFEPLGMKNSEFDDGQNLMINKANNYMRNYGVWVRPPYVNNLFHIGAGCLVTDCDDLKKWYECLKNRRLLSENAYGIYLRENKNNYCYGLERHNENGRVNYSHGGDFMGVSAYTQYFFDDDTCIIILSNNESLNQYRFGNALSIIINGGQPKPSYKLAEIPVSVESLKQYTGTYLSGKIHMEVKNNKLYIVRVNQNIHIELCCIGQNSFIRKYEEQQQPHILLSENDLTPSIWGFKLISKQCI